MREPERDSEGQTDRERDRDRERDHEEFSLLIILSFYESHCRGFFYPFSFDGMDRQ